MSGGLKLKIIAGGYDGNFGCSDVYLKNKVAGLGVTFKNRDHAVFVNLYKLEDDKFPVYKTLKEYDNSDNLHSAYIAYTFFEFILCRFVAPWVSSIILPVPPIIPAAASA